MADFPSMPLWTGDYLADTQDLSAEEHGVYMLLLMAAWRSPDATLPNDDQRLARMAKVGIKKWRKLRPVMERFFTVGDGVIWQKRLVEERQKVENQRAQKRGAANARWHNENDETLSLSASHRNATSKSQRSQSGSGKTPKNNDSAHAAASAPDVRQKCPPPPSPSPPPGDSSPPPVTETARDSAGGGAADDYWCEATPVAKGCRRIQQTLGYVPNDLARYVQRWLDHGLDIDKDVLPTVRAEADRRRQKRITELISSAKYFDKQVFRAHEQRTAGSPGMTIGGDDDDTDSYEHRQRSQWQARMGAYRDRGIWIGQWGPEPGERGCQVPTSVLEEFGYTKARKEAVS